MSQDMYSKKNKVHAGHLRSDADPSHLSLLHSDYAYLQTSTL